MDELTRDRSAMSLEAAERELYLLLTEDIKASVRNDSGGPRKHERKLRAPRHYPT